MHSPYLPNGIQQCYNSTRCYMYLRWEILPLSSHRHFSRIFPLALLLYTRTARVFQLASPVPPDVYFRSHDCLLYCYVYLPSSRCNYLLYLSSVGIMNTYVRTYIFPFGHVFYHQVSLRGPRPFSAPNPPPNQMFILPSHFKLVAVLKILGHTFMCGHHVYV